MADPLKSQIRRDSPVGLKSLFSCVVPNDIFAKRDHAASALATDVLMEAKWSIWSLATYSRITEQIY
jgi:hypothetical protein